MADAWPVGGGDVLVGLGTTGVGYKAVVVRRTWRQTSQYRPGAYAHWTMLLAVGTADSTA